MSEPPTISIGELSSIHLIGVGGSGMSALAKILAQRGVRVSGSDLKPSDVLDALTVVGVETWVGHRPERMENVDAVVASSAVPERDPELSAARAAGVTTARRPALLRGITATIPTIGFSGTHGKTSSTAMAVAALRACGEDPSFIVGGEITDLATGAHLGTDDVLLLEADEAFGTFRHLDLAALGVTNIEADHLDFYGTVTAVEEAFAQVAAATGGPVVGNVDDPGVRRLAQRTDVVGYGTSPGAAWRILEPQIGVESTFVLSGGGGERPVRLPQPGMHMIADAAGVLALLGEAGYDLDCAIEGLGTYRGVRRRFETKAVVGGVTLIDDYAHHPTEVASTVAAAASVTEGRLWVVFQPHRYTRTADLAPMFGEPLAAADRVIVTDVYSAGERPEPGVSGRLVAEAVGAASGDATYLPRLSDVPDEIVPGLEPGDTVVLMGAGDVATIWAEIADRLERGT